MRAMPAKMQSATVGAIRLTYLPDGFHRVRPEIPYGDMDADVWEAHQNFVDDDGWLINSIGSILVEADDRRTLVDLGFGRKTASLLEMTAGAFDGDFVGGDLVGNLRLAGYAPEDIDSVVYSHLHPDHIGWASQPDSDDAVFANATHFVHRPEWDLWTTGEMAGSPAGPTESQLAVLGDRLTLVDDGATPTPGITMIATPGHTPGHANIVVSSGDSRAMILGDMVHCPIELTSQDLDFIFDVDPIVARRTKERIFRELEQPNTMAVGPHFSDRVFGRVIAGAERPSVDFV